MSIRELIIKNCNVPVEIGESAQKLINAYRYNEQVYDSEYDNSPLYALLKIMVYVKRCALVIARKNINSFTCGDTARSNYIVYRAYMEEYQTAYNEFSKYMVDEELNSRLDDVRAKLAKSIAVDYEDRIALMMDIFDMDSSLYEVEGIGYAR